ncbi:hypothetical protein Droror1_Dr00009731 [Drosera rotundifolia]
MEKKIISIKVISLKYSSNTEDGQGKGDALLPSITINFCRNGFTNPSALGAHRNAYLGERELRYLSLKTRDQAPRLGVFHGGRFKSSPRYAPSHRETSGVAKKSEVCLNFIPSVNKQAELHPNNSSLVGGSSPDTIPTRDDRIATSRRGRKRNSPKFDMAACQRFARMMREQRLKKRKKYEEQNASKKNNSESKTENEELDLNLTLGT